MLYDHQALQNRFSNESLNGQTWLVGPQKQEEEQHEEEKQDE